MTEEVPHSVWQGSFKLFGVDVKCHVLSNGQRIIEADSMKEILAAMQGDKDLPPSADDDPAALAKWLHGV
jgi:hypothetical protein